jgi:glutamate-1-semialdehyde 2,1-aminomutase
MNADAGSNSSLDAALDEARARFAAANPRSAARHAAARAAMPGGNTRTVLHHPPFPLAIVRGEGCRIHDLDGHVYLDFLGEYTAGLFGHSNPRIRAAVAEAMEGGITLSSVNTKEAAFAALVRDRFPSIDLVRFTNSGTEANMMALAAATVATGRRRILVFDGGYHGGTLYFGRGGIPINLPHAWVVGRYNDVEGTRALIAEHRADLAAVLVEPLQGSSGCIPAEVDFLAMLREETRAAGAVLIFDEVMTSRLAPGGLQEATGVIPDMTTLGKYIAGGMTVGAFGGRADLMELFDPERPGAMPHAGTFNNNILSMSAGVVALGDIYTPAVARAFNARGDALRERLNTLGAARDVPLRLHGRGSMMAAHFHGGPVRRAEDVAHVPDALKDLFFLDMLAAGIWMARRNMIALSLPIDDDACDRLVDAVDEFLAVRAPMLRNVSN